MLKVIEGFHHQAARWILGMTSQLMKIGKWEWPLVADALDTAGIWPIKEYIQRSQDTIAAQVACHPMYVYELCGL